MRSSGDPTSSAATAGAWQESDVFSPARLRLARELQGITQTELAVRAKLSSAAVSQFERGGGIKPSAASVRALADALEVPHQFLAVQAAPSSWPGEYDDSPGGFFRSLRSYRPAERRRALTIAQCLRDLVAALEEYVELPRRDLPRHPLTETERNREQIDDIASRIRQEWQVPAGPIRDVVALLERQGVVCAHYPLGEDRVDAFSVPFPERPVVVLGSTKGSHDRDRFTAAHELGHLVMHNLGEAGSKATESEAHTFASAFLMPADDIIGALPRKVDWGAYVQLKHEWRVSIGALLRRSRDLNRISDQAYVQAVKYMSYRGWTKQEPGGTVTPDVPTILSSAFRLAVEQAGINEAALSGRTGWPLDIVTPLLGTNYQSRKPQVPV